MLNPKKFLNLTFIFSIISMIKTIIYVTKTLASHFSFSSAILIKSYYNSCNVFFDNIYSVLSVINIFTEFVS